MYGSLWFFQLMHWLCFHLDIIQLFEKIIQRLSILVGNVQKERDAFILSHSLLVQLLTLLLEIATLLFFMH
jgi:hypothetical protein